MAPEQLVFRLIREDVSRFIPQGQSGFNGEAFTPSDTDKKDADELGTPVRVSVWETTVTTVEQARAFRGGMPCRAFRLQVSEVLSVRAKWPNEAARLRVVHDPLPKGDGPGADGHCGIEGLDRPPGVGRLVFKAIRDELARLSVPHE